MTNLTQRPEWRSLEMHYQDIRECRIEELFHEDSRRAALFSIRHGDLLFDYSKHHINAETISHLCALARSCGLESARDEMFNGGIVNRTEGRAVLHTALRAPRSNSLRMNGELIGPLIEGELNHMAEFVAAVHERRWLGCRGKPITHVINIGIGGSDLGPAMTYDALRPFHRPELNVRFVSNVDGADLVKALDGIDADQTLFIVASKSFTTQETLTNARSARQWFLDQGMSEAEIAKHFVALSTNEDAVRAFGIDPQNMFRFWDWVGGRFSLWSAIGLSIALGIGMDNFRALLAGAHEMDRHFRTAPLDRNIPVIMAMLGIWYGGFFGAKAHGVLPYDQGLARFPAYLQQAEMESNGKSVSRDGGPIDYDTCPVVFGEPGTNGQHAFYQLLHQGTQLIPVDFIVPARPLHGLETHHTLLLANCFAQSRALMVGKSRGEVEAELRAAGRSADEISLLAPHQTFGGNRPSSTLLIDRLTPDALGGLIAAYEHKIFTQGILWNVFSFDQWGVQLGKVLAKEIEPLLRGVTAQAEQDASTHALIAAVHTYQNRKPTS